jgi:hypothetical protein
MKFERKRWTPLTIIVETPQEAEVLHKILGLVDHSEADVDLYALYLKLGEGLSNEAVYQAEGEITVFGV